MKTYQILRAIEDITSRDYVVKSWMVDDIYSELMPLFMKEFAFEVWNRAAQEGYEDGLVDATHEMRNVIDDMIKTGKYDLKTLSAVRANL